jgi:hypothetical protein
MATLEERVAKLEDEVKNLLKEVSNLEVDLQILRDHLKIVRERGEPRVVVPSKPVKPVEAGEEKPVKLFPDLGKREEEIEELVYSYVRRKGGLTGIAGCAEELGLKEAQVKRALVSLKLKGKVEF